jgi:hypothetical protein
MSGNHRPGYRLEYAQTAAGKAALARGREALKARRASNRAAGLCACGRPTLPEHRTCATCLSSAKAAARKYQQTEKCRETSRRRRAKHTTRIGVDRWIEATIRQIGDVGRGIE